MNWLERSLFFPIRFFERIDGTWRFKPDALGEFFSRYLVDTSAEPQTIEGVPVTLSPAERDTLLASIYRDNEPLCWFRKASYFDGTLPLEMVYDPPLADPTDPGDQLPIGAVLRCCWPETFPGDIQNPDKSPEEAALLDGIDIL